jgi:hypothetical protein
MTTLRHGEARSAGRTPEWQTWRNMMRRCYEQCTSYAQYGAKGVRVCSRWHRYEDFLADMGRKPSSQHTIDRLDNSKGYSPSNCRWATQAEQNRNKSNCVFLVFNGERRVLAEWARIRGLNEGTLRSRISKGLSIQDALDTKVGRWKEPR